jgi:hypothetical protein
MSYPSNRPSVEIIVGICSARSTRDRRDAVRETWLSYPQEGIECLFFVGGGETLAGEPDTVVLSCPDGYEELPEKVLSFFRHCLDCYDFEWLFKCDDDTYLALDRLRDLLDLGAELVGNDHLDVRGAPSGGAGYLLSRRMVELLVRQPDLSLRGPEDIIIGEAVIRLGAGFRSSERLWSSNDKFPARDNNMITSHWCSPGRLRTIHANLLETPRIVAVKHSAWADNLSLYPSGYFSRHESRCSGRWHEADSGLILLEWFEWGKEILIPEPDSSENEIAHDQYRCVPSPSMPERQEGSVPDATEPSDSGLPPEETIAVFLTTSDYGLPHIDRFLELNPGIPVHVMSSPIAPAGEARGRAWRNCDLPIRQWWLREGRLIDFRFAVFLEWDALFDNTVAAVFPGDHDFYCRDLKKPGMPWGWFEQIDRLPESLRSFATGTPPMAVLRISKRCLEAIFSHPDADEAYTRDIQAELRFATLASACGFEPVECPGTLPHVSCWQTSVGFGPSVWHSVKQRQEDFPRLPESLKILLADAEPAMAGTGE